MSTFFRSPAASPAQTRPDAANPEESPQITTRSARRARHAGQDRVAELEEENSQLRAELDRLRSQKRPIRRSNSLGSGRPKRTAEKRRRHLLRDSIMHTVEEDEGGDGSANVRITRNKISRQASIGTATVLKQMPSTPRPAGFSLELPTRVVAVFREPLRSEHTEYLGSSQFADDILNLARQAGRRFEREPRVLRLESPAYVFGDTHGNLEDLHFFSDHIWKLGISLTAGQLLFLGDYVDRGLSSLEVVAYLLALKCLEPQKVWLLRGNHETRDVRVGVLSYAARRPPCHRRVDAVERLSRRWRRGVAPRSTTSMRRGVSRRWRREITPSRVAGQRLGGALRRPIFPLAVQASVRGRVGSRCVGRCQCVFRPVAVVCGD